MKEAFKIICKNPIGFQIRYDNNRIYFTKIFPYGIHYQCHEKKRSTHKGSLSYSKRSSNLGIVEIFSQIISQFLRYYDLTFFVLLNLQFSKDTYEHLICEITSFLIDGEI